MEKQKQVRVDVDHSNPAFFADGISVSHNQNKFVIDFVQTTPRFEVLPDGNRQESMVVKHNTIVLDSPLAKNFVDILKTNMKNYEEKFGELKIKTEKTKAKGKAPVVSAHHLETRYIG